jgi:hypothetical protein
MVFLGVGVSPVYLRGHGESVFACASTLVRRGEYRDQTGIWRLLGFGSVRTIKGRSSGRVTRGSPWRQLLSLPIPCHVHWPRSRSYCRSRARTADVCRKPVSDLSRNGTWGPPEQRRAEGRYGRGGRLRIAAPANCRAASRLDGSTTTCAASRGRCTAPPHEHHPVLGDGSRDLGTQRRRAVTCERNGVTGRAAYGCAAAACGGLRPGSCCASEGT